MKKIYSFIAVASLMLTSVLSFTSCQKDDMPAQSNNTNTNTNKTEQTQAKQTEETNQTSGYNYFGYQMFVNDDLLALGDIVVTVKYDDKTTDYKVSEGQTASVDSKYFIDKYTNAIAGMVNIDTKFKKDTYTGKKLVIPTFQSSSHKATFTWKFVPNDAAFAALDMNGSTDMFIFVGNMASKNNNISLDVTDLQHFSGSETSTYKKKYDKVVSSDGVMNSRIIEFMNRKARVYSTDFE